MRKILSIIFFFIASGFIPVFSQLHDSIEVFLITCFPGREIETIYGHSAIRIVNHSINYDSVYNWGVFYFKTPNFAWKFAKGRLKYQVDSDTYDRFLQVYFFEQRSVISQKINLNSTEKSIIINLINKNLLPDNRFYLYDFFYDNCATRIRDLIEKTVGINLVYPVDTNIENPTFREMINKAQLPMPWLTFATDLLIGKPGDKKAEFRDQMFLPEDLMKNLSLAMINGKNKGIPLLQEPVSILSFENRVTKNTQLLTPIYLFAILLIIIIVISIRLHNYKVSLWLDRSLFFIFSILAIFMIFFNFITDHAATKMNLNIIWLNPFLVVALIFLFTQNKGTIWFKIITLTSFGFLISLIIIPQSINFAFVPLILILLIRSILRSNLTIIKLRTETSKNLKKFWR